MRGGDVAEVLRWLPRIRADYEPHRADDVFAPEDRAERVKRAMAERLTEAERTVVILYAEVRSLRKLGVALGVSHATVRKELDRIRGKIFDALKEEGETR